MMAFALGMVTGGAVVFFWLAILGRAEARRREREHGPDYGGGIGGA